MIELVVTGVFFLLVGYPLIFNLLEVIIHLVLRSIWLVIKSISLISNMSEKTLRMILLFTLHVTDFSLRFAINLTQLIIMGVFKTINIIIWLLLVTFSIKSTRTHRRRRRDGQDAQDRSFRRLSQPQNYGWVFPDQNNRPRQPPRPQHRPTPDLSTLLFNNNINKQNTIPTPSAPPVQELGDFPINQQSSSSQNNPIGNGRGLIGLRLRSSGECQPSGNQRITRSISGSTTASSSEGINENECPICLYEFGEIRREERLLSSLECGHVLCKNCADGLMTRGKPERICPNCRAPLTQNPRILYL